MLTVSEYEAKVMAADYAAAIEAQMGGGDDYDDYGDGYGDDYYDDGYGDDYYGDEGYNGYNGNGYNGNGYNGFTDDLGYYP